MVLLHSAVLRLPKPSNRSENPDSSEEFALNQHDTVSQDKKPNYAPPTKRGNI